MAKKLYYKIGEACKILEIQPYVLRYWEKEFPLLSPTKSKSGQRVYNERELEVIRRIKELLYDEGYTIAGAKKKLEAELAEPQAGGEPAATATETPAAEPRSDAATPAEEPGPVANPQGDGDPGDDEAFHRLRAGIEEALVQAREILGELESTPP